MGTSVRLPYSIRFIPTEEELICYYLKRWIQRKPIPELKDHGLMAFKNLYGDNAIPWELFKKDDPTVPWHEDVDSLSKVHDAKVIYVFNKLSNVGQTEKSGDKQKNRVAGCGTWHGNTPQKPVRCRNGKRVGFKRTLTFRTPEEVVTDGQWTMTEYSIDAAANDVSQNNIPPGMNLEDYVLCRIKWDDSKSSQEGKIIRKRKTHAEEPSNTPSEQNMLIKGEEDEEEEIISNQTCTWDGASTCGCVHAAAGGNHQGSPSVNNSLEDYAGEESTDPNPCFDDTDAI